MKHIYLSFLIFICILGFGGCSDDIYDPSQNNIEVGEDEVAYTLQMSLPDNFQTRAAAPGMIGSDGLLSFKRDLNKLWYAVYYDNHILYHSEQPSSQQAVKTGKGFSLVTKFHRDLDPTKIYFFFWAGDKDDNVTVNALGETSGFNLDFENKTVSVNPKYINGDGTLAEYDSYAGYFQLSSSKNVSSYNLNYSLKRPFCQIHVLTDRFIDSKGDYADGITATVGLGKNEADVSNFAAETKVPTVWRFDNNVASKSGVSGFKTNTYEFSNSLSGNAPERVTWNGKTMDYIGCFIMFAPQTKQAVKDDGESDPIVYSKFNVCYKKKGATGAPEVFASVDLPVDGLKANERYVISGTFGEDDSWKWLHIHGKFTDTSYATYWKIYELSTSIADLVDKDSKEFDLDIKDGNAEYLFGTKYDDYSNNPKLESATISGGCDISSSLGMFKNCSYLKSLDVSNFDTSNIVNMNSMFERCSSLTSLDLSSFNTSDVTDMYHMFYYCYGLRSLDVSNFDTSNVTDMNNIFSNCSGLRSLDLSNWNTSNVINMEKMFENCSSLSSLDVSNFDTSKVTNMERMFGGNYQLTSLDVSNFDTAKVTNMKSLFGNCRGLKSLDLSSFDTSNVINMASMFGNCFGLTSLDVSNFDTSKVTNMNSMFLQCYELTSLDVSNFDTSNVTDMYQMFDRCYKPTSLDVSNFDTSKVTNMASMFKECRSLTSLDVSNFDTSKVTNMESMFGGCYKLTSLDVSNFDTSQVIDMESMFCECYKLTSLDVSNFDTSKVTNMESMFSDCYELTSLDVSNFDTSKVTNMKLMFDDCNKLTSLDVSNFDTSKVTNMKRMFSGCYELTSLDVSNFDTSKVTNMELMFGGCHEFTSLDVSNFDTSKVTNMESMFGGCYELTSLDVSNFDTSKVTNMKSLFYNCRSLTSLDVSNFDTSKVTNMTDMSSMFYNCSSLKDIKCKQAFKDWCETNKSTIGLTNFDLINWEIVD